MLLPALRILALSVCMVLSLPSGSRSAAVTVTLAPPTNKNQTETIPATTASVQGRSAALTSSSISAQNVHEKRSISLLMPILGSLTSGLLSSILGGGDGGGDRGGGYSNGASGLGGGLIGLLGSLLSSRVGLGGSNFNFNARPINDDGGLYGSASSPNSYSSNSYSSNSAPGMDFSLDLGKLSNNLMNGFRLGKAAGSAGGRFLGNILTSAGGAIQGFQGNHGGGQQQQSQNNYNYQQQAPPPPKVEVYEAAPAGYHQQPMFIPAPPMEYGYAMPQPQPYLYGNDEKAPAQVTFPSDNYLYEGRVADKGNQGSGGGGAVRYNDYDSDTRDKYQQQQQYRQPSSSRQPKAQENQEYQAVSASGSPYKVVVNRGNANSDTSNRQQRYRGQTVKGQSDSLQYDTSSAASQVAAQSGYGDNGEATNNGYVALAYDGHQNEKQSDDSFGSSDSFYEQGETRLYPQVMFPTGPMYNFADGVGHQAVGSFDGNNYVFLNQHGEFQHQDE